VDNPLQMQGRRVLVTGASSGIGRETAILFSRLGAQVALVGRNAERLADTASSLDGKGHHVEVFDLTRNDDIPEWMRELCGRIGPLSGLAHCAGAQMTRPLRMTSTDNLETLMRVNVGSALALAKGFRQRGVCHGDGSIVFLSSVTGIVGESGRAAYSASKAALIGLTRSLAIELVRDSIRVNCIAPAVVRTPMWEETQAVLTPEQIAAIESKHPLGLGTPLDIAHAVAFLIAGTGRWITGTTLVVDGGFTAA
jgi:3-oxoacyl-[acyl-carrier protein] reductase